MKQKGFMLVETLVASTIILGALIYLFIQFSSIKRSYDTSFKYDTIPSLYKTRELANFMSNSANDIDALNIALNTNTYGYINFYDNEKCYGSFNSNLCSSLIKKMDIKHIIYTKSNIDSLQQHLSGNSYNKNIFGDGFKKYILSLDNNTTSGNNRLIIEYKDDTFASVNLNI